MRHALIEMGRNARSLGRALLLPVRLFIGLLIMGPQIAPADDLKAARELVYAGRYDESELAFRSLLESSGPQAGQAAADLAALYEQLGEIDAAAVMYERALATKELSRFEAERLQLVMDHCKRQRASLVRFPVSVEAETDVKQAHALITAKQWPAALAVIRSVLERFDGTFLQRGPGQYLGIGQWARTTLESMPAPGRTAYTDWSAQAWRNALEDGSPGAFRDFANAHPGDPVLQTALFAWADAMADQGALRQAMGLASRRSMPDDQTQSRIQSWSRASPEAPVALPRQWSAPEITAGAGQGLRIERSALSDARSPGIAIEGDKLFICRDFRIEAYDTRDGRNLWSYAPNEPMDRLDDAGEIFGKTNYPRQKWTGAIDPIALTVCPAGILRNERYHHGPRDYAESTLTCLRLENGTVRWRLNRDPVLAALTVCGEPVYSGGMVLITAASRGEFSEYWLCALDSEDGRLLWRQRIAVGATPTTCVGRGMLHSGRSGPTLAADGEVIYYATHMGAVVVGSSRVDLQACKLEYSIVSPK